MRYEQQNVWKTAWKPWVWTVITTNIGWTKNGRNPMGAGIALQAAERFPDLPIWYGEICITHRSDTPVVGHRFSGSLGAANLVLFPTKPLDEAAPQLSWRQPSAIWLIEKSAIQLRKLFVNGDSGLEQAKRRVEVHVPAVGCSNGGLSKEVVVPILERILVEDIFVFVSSRS